MHRYHHRAFYLSLLSVALIAVGLIALNFPVFIDVYDQFGFQIKCGTGYSTNPVLLVILTFVAATVWGRESVFGEDSPA